MLDTLFFVLIPVQIPHTADNQCRKRRKKDIVHMIDTIVDTLVNDFCVVITGWLKHH